MPRVVGVRFRPATKIYFFDSTGFDDLKAGEYVIVETVRAKEMGRVVIPPHEVSDQEVVGQLKPIIRRATTQDLLQMQQNAWRQEEALARCREKVAEYGLPMKVVRAEYNFDRSLLTFLFTAEKRVDFRELVRDLARIFRTRIELRQIGVRDEAKLLGGLGPCGRPLCCITHLCDFSPVSIKMAKHQDLPLSPTEISGMCGRLLCCLAYEDEFYQEVKRLLPGVGEVVMTPYGPGKVSSANVIKQTVMVALESGATIELSAKELQSEVQETAVLPKRRRRSQGSHHPRSENRPDDSSEEEMTRGNGLE
ncbi:MAG: stage 0 sporulation family protein [Chloroflexi bacterium]|nr:stage 0 sporulation family protein [Chloroflexota bacterium]